MLTLLVLFHQETSGTGLPPLDSHLKIKNVILIIEMTHYNTSLGFMK